MSKNNYYIFMPQSDRFTGRAQVVASTANEASDLIVEYVKDFIGEDVANDCFLAFILDKNSKSFLVDSECWRLTVEKAVDDTQKFVILDFNFGDIAI